MAIDSALKYQLVAECGSARAANLTLPHGTLKTPVFMPVGTNGTIKGLTNEEVEKLGFGIILGNTYHLGNRPGLDVIEKVGGLHKFMNWNRNLLTDSGGFQMVSLLPLAKVTEEGVLFRSPHDGSQMALTPEHSMRIQNAIGADIIMALDDVVATMTELPRIEEAMYRTLRWIDRCIEAHKRPHDQNLFGIVQGGLDPELRKICIKNLLSKNLPGYAIGGLSGGEAKDVFWRIVKICTDLLPKDKPRYLMGVGHALDMVVCVALGVDMFDCVYPSRTARLGTALARRGNLNLRSAVHQCSYVPIEEECLCEVCKRYTRAYLHFLYKTEGIACQLLTIHNLSFQKRLMDNLHQAIANGVFPEFVCEFLLHQFPEKDYPAWVVKALHSLVSARCSRGLDKTDSTGAPRILHESSAPRRLFFWDSKITMKLAVPPVEDWDIKWEDIELGEQIGKGSFGLVFKAKYMGIDVTAKQISGDVEKVKKFHHEASILRCGDKFYLIQEYVSMGSLHSILTNHSIELSWAVCSKMALEISQATLFLHRKGILHRDLKAENVLVEGSEYDLSTTGFFGRCKVADFGLSTLLSDDEVPMSEVGTPWWRAPELSTHHYGPAADVFSFGILLCEIITRRNGDDIRAGMTYERNRLDFATDPELLMKDPELGPLMAMSPPGMKDLAMRCCREDPNERPKTEQLVQELECLSLKFVELSKYCFSMLKKLLLGSDGNDSYHEDILPQLIYVPYKIWVTAVGALIEKDTDVAQLRVPAARVFDLIEKRLQRQMGRCLDELGKQFLSKVMKVQGKNPPIDIKDFSRLWKWVSVFERSIRHRTVLPLFRYGFIHGFVYSRTARQLLLNHGVDGTFIIHSSSSQPDSLIVSYLHKKKLHQVRIKLGALDDPRGGHFILKNSKFKTLTEALSHISNFHATTQRPVLQYVYPNRPIDAPEFQKALLEVERCPGVSRPL